jgi:hypothetical protein
MEIFSTIGFDIKDKEDLQQLSQNIFHQCKPIQIPKGLYVLYTDSSGAQLSLAYNKKEQYYDVRPLFKGLNTWHIAITRKNKRTDLNTIFYGWLAPTDTEEPESGIYPFAFEVPHFKLFNKLKLPQNVYIKLTAFTLSLNVYNDQNSFYGTQNTAIKFGSQSFFSSEAYREDDDTQNIFPQPWAMFTGNIKDFELKQNQLTDKQFYWLLVETYGGEIDVVADIHFFKTVPKVGEIISGKFWFSGQIQN